MNREEKMDFALLGLYQMTKDGGMLNIKGAFIENEQDLNDAELKYIINMTKDLAVYQPIKYGYKGQITQKGIEFVEQNSFSKPETSILELEGK